jgi:ABC-type glycerol-3-phosphate transport system substrate-binding protein
MEDRTRSRWCLRGNWHKGVLAIGLSLVLGGSVTVASAPVEISYMSWYTGETDALEQTVIARFNELNPDIRVVKIGGDPRQKLLTMIAGGAPPDVSIVNGVTQPHHLADVAMDITAHVQRAKVDMKAYLPGLEQTVSRKGRIYGLPWGFGFFNMMINVSMFENAGLSLPQPKWTLDDMARAARSLTRDTTGDGQPDVYGLNPGFIDVEEPLFMAHGASIVDPTTGRTDVHAPAYVDAVQYVADLINTERIASTNVFGAANRRMAFTAGRYGMTGEWQSALNWFVAQRTHETFDWAMVYWPVGRGPQTTLGWGHTVSVIKGTPHPDEATRFVLFWADWETESRLADSGVYPQTLRGLQTMVRKLNLPSRYSAQQVMGPLLNLPARPFVPPFEVPGYVEARDVIRPALVSAVQGQAPAKQLFEEVRARVDALLSGGK